MYIYMMFEKPNMTPIPKTWGFCRFLLSGSLISGMRIFAPVMGDLKGLFLAGSGQAARPQILILVRSNAQIPSGNLT